MKGLSDNKTISKNLLLRVIDKIFMFSHTRGMIPEIGFFGKEPILNFNLIQYATEYISSKRYNCLLSVNTNGKLLKQEQYDFLVKNKFKIVLSIDRDISEKSHPLRLASEYRDNITVRTTINSQNLFFLPQIISEFYEYGFIALSIAFDYTDQRFLNLNIKDISDVLSESLITYLKIKKRDETYSIPLFDRIIFYSINKRRSRFNKEPFCQLGDRILSVDINGDIYPCWRFIQDKKFVIYNILEDLPASRKYKIELANTYVNKIVPFDFICFWAYSHNKIALKNNIRIMQSMKMTSEKIKQSSQ